jgi:uncharacterized repeat protein (TIGR01451 family)
MTNQVAYWPVITRMTNGQATDFTVTITAPAIPGALTNRVTSTADTLDPVPANNDGTAAAAIVITTVIPPGVEVSGRAYADANRNSFWDTTETGTGLALYAKLIVSSTPSGPAIQAAAANPTSGLYKFTGVTNGSYIIVIDNNNTLADITPTIPSGWVGAEAPAYTRFNVLVNSVNVPNQNFGLVQASTLTGAVFKDTGVGGGTANDGVKNGGETGIVAVTIKLTDATGGTVYDTKTTDGIGNYTLFIPSTIANGTSLRVVEQNLSAYRSTGASVGNTRGNYDRPADAITFTCTSGMNYTGVDFGDVPDNQFLTDGQQAALPGSVAFYTHRFIAGTAGQVTFSLANLPNPSFGGWNPVLYRDSNGNGQLESGEPVLTGAVTVTTDEKIDLIVKEFVPVNAPLNAQDQIIITALFTYSGVIPALSASYTHTDLTTVGTPANAGLTLVKAVDKAAAAPGETITYTITYENKSSEALSNMIIYESMPAFTTFINAGHGALPPNLTQVTITMPSAGRKGPIRWTFAGTLAPGSAGTVTFSVILE